MNETKKKQSQIEGLEVENKTLEKNFKIELKQILFESAQHVQDDGNKMIWTFLTVSVDWYEAPLIGL